MSIEQPAVAEIGSIDNLNASHTIGLLEVEDGQTLQGHTAFSPGLIAEAVEHFDEEFSGAAAEVALAKRDDGGSPLLALVPEDVDGRAVVVAPRITDHSHGDRLVVEDGDSP